VAELERLKEEVGHLKLWEGIVVVSATGLAGWLFSTGESAGQLTFGLAMGGVLFLGLGALFMYRQIAGLIDRIGEL
jgi:amino acid transporter